VLVDVRRPGLDGYQLCANLNNDPITRRIPVIFISAIDRLIYQAPALLSSAVDYVTEPFDAEEVLWRIESHISLRRLRANLESAARNDSAQPTATAENLDRAFQEIRVLTQITGRKHAEEKVRHTERELRRREAFFAEAQRLSSTGSFSWRVATDDITWSAEMYRIHGIDCPVAVTWELIGSRIHPEDLPAFKERVEQARRGGTGFEFEHRLQSPDQSVKYVHVVAHGMRNDDGQLEYVGAVQDVTERRLSEDAIRALKDQLYNENLVLREEVDRTSMFEEIVGTSAALKPVLARVAKVARTDSTVLITGETGTGKELVARAIHRRSARASAAFVSVNCAAIPRDLIASELFGHEKGAFTGATQRRLGRFELAHGGTIFLDEVGDLPLETQVALLRVLQEREFERVGGAAPVHVDVRVIAATNRDLESAVEAGTFRSELFYRLNVFPISVPALRERADDISLLVEYFIERYARKTGKAFRRVKKRTLDQLRSYPWPGNVRELQNVIERSVIVCDTDEFTVDESWLSARPVLDGRVALSGALATHEKEIIEDALRASAGRVFGPSGAAARLGIPRSTLESKIRALRINKSRFRARTAKS
jgi:PAS domain S-box-containing protein